MKKLLLILLCVPLIGFGQTDSVKLYYENGQIESLETYKKNKRNGTAKSWHKNGNIRFEGNYLNGVLDGNWKSWDEEGNEIERK